MVDMTDLRGRMESTLANANKDFSGLRTGRASAALVDGVVADVYGAPMPLNQVATISVPEPRMITVQVWDTSNVPAVEKGIINADLGLNPSSEGNLIRLPIPDLTEERRVEMVKIGGQYAENAKIAIRNIRRDGMDAIKKDDELGEDDKRSASDEVQTLTDEFVKKIDEAFEAKKAEIMTV